MGEKFVDFVGVNGALPFTNTKINILLYSIFYIYIDLFTHLFKFQYHIIYF